MDCKVFTKNIYQFILDDLSMEEKMKMEKHVEECDKCRELYNKELEIEKTLRSFFDEEEIIVEEEFKKGILERINNNRYKKQKKNKNINISKYMKIITPIAAGFFIFIIFTRGNFMMRSENMTEEAGNASANSTMMEEHDLENNESETSIKNGIGSDGDYADDSLDFTINRINEEEFYTLINEDADHVEDNIFENSSKKEYSAVLLEKKNIILINNQENGEKLILEVQLKDKFSIIKNIEWYDEGYLLILSGNVEEGGKLVSLLNIINSKNTKVYEIKNNKSYITDVHYISDKSITINVKVYEEETKKFHNEDVKLYNIEKVK
ncbi:zf-HC2 domain-containing protein [Clostridium sp. DL1XJH146]